MAKFLDKMERKFRWLAIPHLTMWLVGMQVFFFAFGLAGFPVEMLQLMPTKVFEGEVWRLISWIFQPPTYQFNIFIIFGWILLYVYGTALEEEWGEFRYTIYVLIGFVLTIFASFIAMLLLGRQGETYWVTNVYVLTSIMFAFARRNPDFTLMLFFVLPVKIKWIAYVIGAFFALTFLAGGIVTKLEIAAAVANFFIFFGREMVSNVKRDQRRRSYHAQARVDETEAFHRCVICGATDQSHPDRQFFYQKGRGYCEEHAFAMDLSEDEQRELAKEKGGKFPE